MAKVYKCIAYCKNDDHDHEAYWGNYDLDDYVNNNVDDGDDGDTDDKDKDDDKDDYSIRW